MMRKQLIYCFIDLFHPMSLAVWITLLNVRTYASIHWGKGFILLAHCSNVIIYWLLPFLFTLLCLKAFQDYLGASSRNRIYFSTSHLLLTILSEMALEGATKGKAFYIAPLLSCYTSAGIFLLSYIFMKAINDSKKERNGL